jgi:hypothetical protein
MRKRMAAENDTVRLLGGGYRITATRGVNGVWSISARPFGRSERYEKRNTTLSETMDRMRAAIQRVDPDHGPLDFSVIDALQNQEVEPRPRHPGGYYAPPAPPIVHLHVVDMGAVGMGVVNVGPLIPQGTHLGTYAGARTEIRPPETTYVYGAGSGYVDGRHGGNWASFINGTLGEALPNVMVGPDLGVMTLHDIDSGVELLVNYGDAFWEEEALRDPHTRIVPNGTCAFCKTEKATHP